MGDVSLIHISPDSQVNWTVKTPPQSQLKIGDKVHLYINTEKIHFFDKESELNLSFE